MSTTRASHANRGIIALISVMIITSFILIYGLSIALMNADEAIASDSRLSASKVGNLTSSCVNNALARLRRDNTVSGAVSLNVNSGDTNTHCTAIIAGSGNTRTINASATTTSALGGSMVGRTNTNVNIATNPFTIIDYKDILD